MKKTIRSFGHALRGIKYATRGRNFRIQIVCGAIAITLSTYLHISKTDWLLVILAIGLVLSMEATNTAVEEICNKFHPEKHPHIALIKDLSAGAVLIGALAAGIVGICIFIPYIQVL